MPKWIHDRAKHIQAKNPDMPESQAWAISTQQSHALSKTPKDYGTAEGKQEAKAKYDTPQDDKKTADPGGIGKEKDAGFFGKLFKHTAGSTMDDYTRQIVREEMTRAHQQEKHPGKIKTAGIHCVLDLLDGFSDELRKIAQAGRLTKTANFSPSAGLPTRVSEVTSAMPRATGKTPLPKVTPVNADTSPSPMQGMQPVLNPPSVRG